MKNVIFFVEPEWAFGTIHYDLCKYMFQHGYYCNVLSWKIQYTPNEITELDSSIDFWVLPGQVYNSFKKVHKIHPQRIIVILHSIFDVDALLRDNLVEEAFLFRNYGAVSQRLVDYSISKGIKRIPHLTPLGVNFNKFYSKPSSSLKTIGFAGAFNGTHFGTGVDIKRGYLVEEVAKRTGLPFKVATQYHNSFVTMAGFYKTVDCVIAASTEEGAGLPVLEGGAAGKLVLSTPVGHWTSRVKDAGGITLPLSEKDFVDECVKILTFYKSNPDAYQARCEEIQQHARSYDWACCIEHWVKVFESKDDVLDYIETETLQAVEQRMQSGGLYMLKINEGNGCEVLKKILEHAADRIHLPHVIQFKTNLLSPSTEDDDVIQIYTGLGYDLDPRTESANRMRLNLQRLKAKTKFSKAFKNYYIEGCPPNYSLDYLPHENTLESAQEYCIENGYSGVTFYDNLFLVRSGSYMNRDEKEAIMSWVYL